MMRTGYNPVMRQRRLPEESVESGLDRIRRTARMRYGMIGGLVIVALAQAWPITTSESWPELLRDLGPAIAIAAIAIPAVAWVARRDERRVKDRQGIRRR